MSKTIAIIAALAAVAVVVVVAVIFADDGLDDRAEAVLEEPEEFYGERVEVEGNLSSFYDGAFTLGGGLFNQDELLVVHDGVDDLPAPVRNRRDDAEVRVVGVVERNRQGLELIPGERFEPFEDGPYVRAQQVSLEEED